MRFLSTSKKVLKASFWIGFKEWRFNRLKYVVIVCFITWENIAAFFETEEANIREVSQTDINIIQTTIHKPYSEMHNYIPIHAYTHRYINA